ncbi:MAG: hypothetical protein ABI977_28635 [Acidobacteriota bacterium]
MKIIALFLLLAMLTVVGFTQSHIPPSIGKDALLNPGKVFTSYDEFTDKSKIEALIPVSGNNQVGVFLFVATEFVGRRARSPLDTSLVFWVVSEKATHRGDSIYLILDGQRVEVQPDYASGVLDDTKKMYEIFVMPKTLDLKGIVAIHQTKQFRGRIGKYLEFELTDRARSMLKDYGFAVIEAEAK